MCIRDRNAAMRGVVKTLANGKEEVEIYGFLDGYRGLIYGNFRMLTDKAVSYTHLSLCQCRALYDLLPPVHAGV